MVSIRPPRRSSGTSNPPYWNTAFDKVAVVVNGNARGVTDDIVRILDQIVESGDLFVSRSMVEGRDIARAIAERGYRTVLTGGGDGTFVQMVSWIVQIAESLQQTPPRFGLLKLGTGNALAWVLGAHSKGSKGIVADISRLRMEEGCKVIRLIEIEDLLTPFAGLGADAVALSHHAQVRDLFNSVKPLRSLSTGAVTYTTSLLGRTAPDLILSQPSIVKIINQGEPAFKIGRDREPLADPIKKGDLLYEGPARLVAFSTIPYWGFGARIFPYATKREDRFNLRIANLGPIRAIANIRPIWKGTYQTDGLIDFLVEKISIHCDTPTHLQVGGDVLGRRTVVNAELSKRLIRFVDYYI
jgi:diacylglycerol kinase family enzyme